MKVSKQVNDCIIDMYAGLKNNKLKFIIAITNIGDEVFRDESAMSSWYNFKLVDDNNIHRVDSMVEFAAITPHKIEPRETLYSTVVPNTLEEAKAEAKEWNERGYPFRAITDIEEYKLSNKDDKVDFVPYVCTDKDDKTEFEAEFTIKLNSIQEKLQLNFTLSELSELSDLDTLYDDLK